jgi:hypothetical protein
MAYQAGGQLDRAISLYEGALAGTEQVLGTGRPNATLIRANLEAAYKEAGRGTRRLRRRKG